jgi:hypothetical protein
MAGLVDPPAAAAWLAALHRLLVVQHLVVIRLLRDLHSARPRRHTLMVDSYYPKHGVYNLKQ